MKLRRGITAEFSTLEVIRTHARQIWETDVSIREEETGIIEPASRPTCTAKPSREKRTPRCDRVRGNPSPTPARSDEKKNHNNGGPRCYSCGGNHLSTDKTCPNYSSSRVNLKTPRVAAQRLVESFSEEDTDDSFELSESSIDNTESEASDTTPRPSADLGDLLANEEAEHFHGMHPETEYIPQYHSMRVLDESQEAEDLESNISDYSFSELPPTSDAGDSNLTQEAKPLALNSWRLDGVRQAFVELSPFPFSVELPFSASPRWNKCHYCHKGKSDKLTNAYRTPSKRHEPNATGFASCVSYLTEPETEGERVNTPDLSPHTPRFGYNQGQICVVCQDCALVNRRVVATPTNGLNHDHEFSVCEHLTHIVIDPFCLDLPSSPNQGAIGESSHSSTTLSATEDDNHLPPGLENEEQAHFEGIPLNWLGDPDFESGTIIDVTSPPPVGVTSMEQEIQWFDKSRIRRGLRSLTALEVYVNQRWLNRYHTYTSESDQYSTDEGPITHTEVMDHPVDHPSFPSHYRAQLVLRKIRTLEIEEDRVS
ncbi:hypothetical protein R3P38DRAFT_3203087 [Favolaschia claudopus]|uniref:Uncharacterized protein n=1 Tax=Favolaschia claudopus TaxID=2862362 RepID=A0AAW0AUB4_9AGAR